MYHLNFCTFVVIKFNRMEVNELYEPLNKLKSEYSVDEISDLLGVNPSTVYNYLKKDYIRTPKIGSIAWHELQIVKKKIKRVLKSYKNGKLRETLSKRPAKIPKTKFVSYVEYDFLKYIRLVNRWVLEQNPNLTRTDLELLLYLYGVGAFTKSLFYSYHKTMGIYSVKTFKTMLEDNIITMYRPKMGESPALYVLSNKTKKICKDMHLYCIGQKELPTSKDKALISRDKAPRINNYYLDLIKRMNKDRED